MVKAFEANVHSCDVPNFSGFLFNNILHFYVYLGPIQFNNDHFKQDFKNPDVPKFFLLIP